KVVVEQMAGQPNVRIHISDCHHSIGEGWCASHRSISSAHDACIPGVAKIEAVTMAQDRKRPCGDIDGGVSCHTTKSRADQRGAGSDGGDQSVLIDSCDRW